MKGRLISVFAAVLVLGAFGATFAMAASDGTYRGKTGGEQAVKIKVKKGRVTYFDTDVYSYPIGLTTFRFPPAGQKGRTARIKSNGKFKIVFQADPSGDTSLDDDKRTITGQFKGSKVSGDIKIEGLLSAEDTFTAKR